MSELVTVRELGTQDLPAAFTVIRALRANLDPEQFQHRVAKQARAGYRLVGAFDVRGGIVGVLGMRPVSTLARGDHLHVDDLAVLEPNRNRGIGTSLMQYAERWAAQNALLAIFLDSRDEALPFYRALGYEPHTAILMRKRIT